MQLTENMDDALVVAREEGEEKGVEEGIDIGVEKGKTEGFEKGVRIGIERSMKEILSLIKNGYNLEDIENIIKVRLKG